MTKEDLFLLGKLTKPFGFHGDLVAWFDVDDTAPYEKVGSFWVETSQGLVPHFVSTIRPHGDRFVVQLEGVDSEEKAQKLSGRSIYLPLSLLPSLDETQFYFHEVVGWEAKHEETGASGGTILRVLEHGPYPMLETLWEGNHALIPLPAEIPVRVDRQHRVLWLVWPEGLLEVFQPSPPPSGEEHDG
jgi:16S rRNA processing protein RimM